MEYPWLVIAQQQGRSPLFADWPDDRLRERFIALLDWPGLLRIAQEP